MTPNQPQPSGGDTPRTNLALTDSQYVPMNGYKWWVQADFARTLERENQQLQQRLEQAEAKLNHNRDGDWIDKWGACKVCDGEIPYGHTDKCDIYKLEKEIKDLQSKLTLDEKN